MPNYQAPGVYFEEPTNSPILVQAAPSDIGAQLGVSQKGPPNRAIKITSWDQFLKAFGTYVTGSYLAHSVRQFFEQGGVALWIVRVVGPSGTVKATLQLSNSTPSNTVLLEAFSVGNHGNELATQVTRVDTVVAAVAVNIGAGAVTEATLDDIRQLYVGATINMAQGGNNLRVTLTRIDPVLKKVFFASRAPTGAINAAGSTVTLEEWNITVYRNGVVSEVIPKNGAFAHDPTAGAKYFKTAINNNDPFREIAVQTDNLLANSNAIDPRPVTNSTPVSLTGGADGAAVTSTEVLAGLPAYDKVYEASMLAIPGWETTTVQQGIITYLENRKTTRMFGILAAPSGQSASAVITYKDSTARLYSNHAGFYYPWVKQVNPLTLAHELFPPEGMVMGVFARTARDISIARAPAGTEVGRINNAVDVETHLSQPEYESLNPVGINAIRAIDGRGICIMGARTLAKGDFLYTNVRRVFNFVENSIRPAFDSMVFEQNDEITRARIERGMASFLKTQWERRVLKGKNVAAAFTVQCDEANNPPSVQQAGQLFVDVGLAIANPAEFIIFRLSRDQREAQNELAQAGL